MTEQVRYIILFNRYSEGAKERIIRMVEAQVDPMEPPKHLIKKCPRGPPSPPVPILHSPPRKLTAGYVFSYEFLFFIFDNCDIVFSSYKSL